MTTGDESSAKKKAVASSDETPADGAAAPTTPGESSTTPARLQPWDATPGRRDASATPGSGMTGSPSKRIAATRA